MAEVQLQGPGWYICWLRFTIALVAAEAAPPEERSGAALAALRILSEVKNPYLGEPTACDLYPIHGQINETLWRAFSLLDDREWERAIEVLDGVSASISTTMFGELDGLMSRDLILQLVVETSTLSRRAAAKRFVDDNIAHGGSGVYYSYLAEYRLIAARLALTFNDKNEGWQYWTDACRLLTAYGWHRDTTIFELLDPLPELIAIDPARGREAVAKLQPLCERIPNHTDGKDTWHTRKRWWKLLAMADPCALADLILPKLMRSCNDPNLLLEGARSDLWKVWYHRADPVIAGALRLTLKDTLDEKDEHALEILADIYESIADGNQKRLLAMLMARIDERPAEYSFSNSKELLDRDQKRVNALNVIANRTGMPRITPLPPSVVDSGDSFSSPYSDFQASAGSHQVNRSNHVFPPGMAGIAQATRVWQDRLYKDTGPNWSVERFANILGCRLVELAETGRQEDASSAVMLIADSLTGNDQVEILKALAEGFELYGHIQLAAVAFALSWTRASGRGGWRRFGGKTEIESLQRAMKLDKGLVLRTIAGEISHVVLRNRGTLGITQALVWGFARGVFDNSPSVAYDIWDEAFEVIVERAPKVSEADDPQDVYKAPNPDNGTDIPGDIDNAFTAATLAGLSHPGREQKRRSLLATQSLIDQRVKSAGAAIGSALVSLSDPATLTWLLRLIELADDKAMPVLSKCEGALVQLAGCPHLTASVIARHLLSRICVSLVNFGEPDSELLEEGRTILLLPVDAKHGGENTKHSKLVDGVAGERLSRVKLILPGLRNAVYRRVGSQIKRKEHQDRLHKQFQTYGCKVKNRRPDAFLATEELVEDAMQRAAAGARVAKLLIGTPVAYPRQFEKVLARALLDDPQLPLAVEWTRCPRPNIPAPPSRCDTLWQALNATTEGVNDRPTHVEAADMIGGMLSGTVSVLNAESVPRLVGGQFDKWRLIATVEQRAIVLEDLHSKKYDVAHRYRCIELRFSEDRQALSLPPVSKGDLRVWSSQLQAGLIADKIIQCQPVVGYDSELLGGGDGRYGLGFQGSLLTPTRWLSAALDLRRTTYFIAEDHNGPALALISWRTEYETNDYELAWPRLHGTGLAVRYDVFDKMINSANGAMKFRDYVDGPANLCG